MQGDSFAECQGTCGPGSGGGGPAGGGAGGNGSSGSGRSGGSGGSGDSGGSPPRGGAGGGDAPAPPPSVEEALATCPTPAEPVIGRNPDPEGLTGLETYLWAQAQEAQTASGAVRGYAVRCTVTPVRWTWDSGDGASYTRERPGGPHPDHAAEHVYETKGEYTQTLTVVWQARTAYGSGTVTRRSSVAYKVIEVRSVRTG